MSRFADESRRGAGGLPLSGSRSVSLQGSAPLKNQATSFRMPIAVKEVAQSKMPIRPKSGTELAVFGSFGAGSAVADSAIAGAGGATAIRTGTSGLGAGGGGGIFPVCFISEVTIVSGTSVTLWTETTMPFFSPNASVSWPLIVNF
jgi:hypothetical protein